MTATTIAEQPNSRTLAVGQTIDGIKMSLLWRHQIQDIRTSAGIPDTAGAYILCEPQPRSDGKWNAYVGKSSEGTLPPRFASHNNNPPSGVKNWTAALMLHGTGRSELSQDEASGLENLLYEHLREKPGVCLANTNAPSDGRVSTGTFKKLERACQRTDIVLRAIGIDVDRQPPSKPKPRPQPSPRPKQSKKPRATAGSSARQKVTARPGLKLEHISAKVSAKAEVLADSSVSLTEIDGAAQNLPPFPSLSAAASHITGYGANGRTFWKEA